ncbi:hypothetical protein OF001_U90085 [Pseudomonas sp. OF001]|nr:hypothetical protein OF001_U90085 [Pseudomonas sp. OF001]
MSGAHPAHQPQTPQRGIQAVRRGHRVQLPARGAHAPGPHTAQRYGAGSAGHRSGAGLYQWRQLRHRFQGTLRRHPAGVPPEAGRGAHSRRRVTGIPSQTLPLPLPLPQTSDCLSLTSTQDQAKIDTINPALKS